MSDLRLSVAVGNYDRMRPLVDNEVRIDGVDPVFMRLSPEDGRTARLCSHHRPSNRKE